MCSFYDEGRPSKEADNTRIKRQYCLCTSVFYFQEASISNRGKQLENSEQTKYKLCNIDNDAAGVPCVLCVMMVGMG